MLDCAQGRLSPLTPWRKFPPPLSSPPLPFPSLPSPPLPLEVGPLIAARGPGERFSSPSGSGRSPAAKRYLVNFRLKISPLVATIFGSFSGNETSKYDRHVGCLLVASTLSIQMCQYERFLICRESNHSGEWDSRSVQPARCCDVPLHFTVETMLHGRDSSCTCGLFASACHTRPTFSNIDPLRRHQL